MPISVTMVLVAAVVAVASAVVGRMPKVEKSNRNSARRKRTSVRNKKTAIARTIAIIASMDGNEKKGWCWSSVGLARHFLTWVRWQGEVGGFLHKMDKDKNM